MLPTVWVVEDDPAFRGALLFLVRSMPEFGAVRAFSDAESALDVLGGEEEPPDLVVLDVGLPGMSGLEALPAFRTAHPDVRIVILTRRDDDEAVLGALRSGVAGYLLKNTSVDDLLAGLREARAGGLLLQGPVARHVLAHFQGTSAPDYGLTERERGVLAELVEGRTQKEIAEALGLSASTVNGHVQRVYEKLRVRSAAAAVALAVRHRLV